MIEKLTITHNGKEFQVDSPSETDLITRRFWKKGQFYELGVLQWMQGNAKGGTWIDGGAHLGNHSIFIANFCDCDKLYSIEPVTPVYKSMVKNVQRNIDQSFFWLPENWALADSAGLLASWGELDYNNLGNTKLTVDHARSLHSEPTHDSYAVTMTIDNIAKNDDVTMLKLDIEGGELMALTGAWRTINRCRPAIVVEAHTSEQLAEIIHLLQPLGYNKVQTWKMNTHALVTQ